MNRYSEKYDLRGLKLAAISFAVIALGNFAVQIIRVFEEQHAIEFIYMALLFFGWMMMFIATRELAVYGRDFRGAHIASMAAVAAPVVAALIFVSNISSKMGKNATLTVGLQFALYVCFLVLILAYWYILRGTGLLCGEFNRPKLAAYCRGIRLPAIVVMMICLVAVQGAAAFSEFIHYIVVGAAAVVMLIAQMLMIRGILNAYDLVDGRVKPGRLEDVITSSKENTGEGAGDSKVSLPNLHEPDIHEEVCENTSSLGQTGSDSNEECKFISQGTASYELEDIDIATEEYFAEDVSKDGAFDKDKVAAGAFEEGTDDTDIVEEDWLRKEFEEIALISKDERQFEDFKDTMSFQRSDIRVCTEKGGSDDE